MKKASEIISKAFWWEQRESNPRPSACKADALNQLSYAPVAVRTGLEPATPGVTGRYSNQLNYRTNCSSYIRFLFQKEYKDMNFYDMRYTLAKIFYKKITINI